MFAACVLAFAVLIPAPASSQTVAEAFFPYAVGDTTHFTPPAQIFASDSIRIDGRKYLLMHGIPCRPMPDTLRVGDTAVWRYGETGDQIVFDFDTADDSVYQFLEFDHDLFTTQDVYVNTGVHMRTATADSLDGRSFYVDNPDALDDGCAYFFASTLGIVYVSGDWGFRFRLEGVEVFIDGVPLAVASTSAKPGAVLEAYPNPTRGLLTVELVERPVATGVTVVDMLGRTVLSLSAPANSDQVKLNLGGLPAGVYGVVTKSEGRPNAILIVKLE